MDLPANHVRVPKSLQVYTQTETRAEAWARILIMGAPKAGKSTTCALTSPRPVLVINCDGPSALTGPANLGAEYRAIDVSTAKQWIDAVHYACDSAEAGEINTIVIDTITLLADSIVDDLSQTLTGHELWGQVLEHIMGGIRDLKHAEAHLIITAHAIASDNSIVGVLPAIAGKSASRAPAMLHDWVWLELDTKHDPAKRRFLVGPQKNWAHGGRNMKRSIAMEADVSLLLEELGIEP